MKQACCYYYEIMKKMPTKKAEKENVSQIIKNSIEGGFLNDSAI